MDYSRDAISARKGSDRYRSGADESLMVISSQGLVRAAMGQGLRDRRFLGIRSVECLGSRRPRLFDASEQLRCAQRSQPRVPVRVRLAGSFDQRRAGT